MPEEEEELMPIVISMAESAPMINWISNISEAAFQLAAIRTV